MSFMYFFFLLIRNSYCEICYNRNFFENIFSVKFEDPHYGDDYIYEAIRLEGVM